MTADDELLASERSVASDPSDASARLALARALTRAGRSPEAAEHLYRARVLGAEAGIVAEGLQAIGAPPSPWTHPDGAAARSRCSPLRGPRRGIVVAGHASVGHDVLVGADGSLLISHGPGRITFLHGRELTTARVLDLGTTVVRLAIGSGSTLYATTTYPEGGVHRASLAVSSGSSELIEAKRDYVYGNPIALSKGGVGWVEYPLRAYGTSTLRLQGTTADNLGALELGSMDRVTQLAHHGDRIAFCETERSKTTLHVRDLRGARIRSVSLKGTLTGGPVFDERGHVFVATWRGYEVLTHDVHAFSVEGEESWCRRLEGMGGGRIAVTSDGACVFAGSDLLARIDPDGELAWSIAVPGADSPLLDREGAVYLTARYEHDPSRYGLAAFAPDGSGMFLIEEAIEPLAIDAWGRLIGRRVDHAAKEKLVAIE